MLQLLGDRLFHKICCDGMISQLLPDFVHRLSPRLRERALAYWNSAARQFRQDGPIRASLPEAIRAKIDTSLSLYREVNQSGPRMEVLARLQGLNDDAYDGTMHAIRSDIHNQAVRILHNPVDLHWVASCGILMTHWRPFIRALQSGYTRSLQPPLVGIFHTTADAKQPVAMPAQTNGYASDTDSD